MPTVLTERTPFTAGDRSRSESSTVSAQSTSSLQGLKRKAHKKIHKLRDRAIPVTKSQKRSRYIPGKRYFPLLWIQWLWHPIRVLWGSVTREKLSDNHHHHRHHHHHHLRHEDVADIDADNCVLGDGREGKMNVIVNDHELLME
jgi:hypothetical protein